VTGDRSNIKITGPEDLALAQFILQQQSLDG
jgi:2-C-methyl-D-erythritol 4-phosphate cytidylyltransferase